MLQQQKFRGTTVVVPVVVVAQWGFEFFAFDFVILLFAHTYVSKRDIKSSRNYLHTVTYLWNVYQFATTLISIAYFVISSCDRFRQKTLIVINN